METPVQNITKKITDSYTITLKEQETIDTFLDEILAKKKEYHQVIRGIKKLSKCLRKLSWIDALEKSDKVLIHGIIAMGKSADFEFRQFYKRETSQESKRRYYTAELADFIDAVEQHKEDLQTIEHIIFELREDQEFKNLSTAVDEL